MVAAVKPLTGGGQRDDGMVVFDGGQAVIW